MDEQIILLLMMVLVIIVLSRLIAGMMKSGNEKYKIPIFYGRILLGFALAMLFYMIYLMLKGVNIVSKFFG